MNRVPLIMTILGVLVLCALGTWQVKRLSWKEGVISRIEDRARQEPVAVDIIIPEQDLDYVHARLTGTFLSDHIFHLRPRVHDGKTGVHVLVPFRLMPVREIVFVNLGWAPEDVSDDSVVSGVGQITGVLRKWDREKPAFAPDNNPAKGEWYWPDLSAMSTQAGLSMVVPYILYLDKGAKENYPVGGQLALNPPNNHLGYAVFWFSMAGLLILFYLLYHRSRGRTS